MAHSLFPGLWGEREKNDHPLANIHREIDRAFEGFISGKHLPFRTPGVEHGKIVPRMDVSESDNAIEVIADLPGVDEKDIEVKLVANVLTIKGEKRSEVEESKKDFHLMERSYGSFERISLLPCEVEADKVKAVFNNGVLKITLPKSKIANTNERRITITAQ